MVQLNNSMVEINSDSKHFIAASGEQSELGVLPLLDVYIPLKLS